MAKRILAQHLIEKMRTRTGLSTAENKKVIETFLDMVMEKVADGNDVQIKNFGTFTYVERKNIITRNVVTGEELEPLNTAFTSFRSSPYFKEKIKAKVEQKPETIEEKPKKTSTATKKTAIKKGTTASKATASGSTAKKPATKKTATKEATASKATASSSTAKKATTKKASTATKTTTKKATTPSKAKSTASKKTTSASKSDSTSESSAPKRRARRTSK